MNGLQENRESMSAQNVIVLTGIEKKCTKCGEIKSLEEFHRNNSQKDGRHYQCKECLCAASRAYGMANSAKRYEKYKLWAKLNPEKVIAAKKLYRKRHPEKVAAANKYHRGINKAQKRENYKRWYRANFEKVKEINDKWRKANPEKVREYGRRWAKENPESRRNRDKRFRSTPKGHLNTNISTAIRISLNNNKNGYHWESLVGYTLEQLKEHLEKQFKSGMTWDNYGLYGWHIDHIIPIVAHNFEKPEDEDFKRCWSLNNLQPLWAFDNLSKNNKISKPFQPKLIFK